MKLPPLNALRAFECAARTGSFAAAGAEMGVTSAAVSLQVKNLEDWLGRNLFTRQANQIRLTDAGRDYYMNAASALTEIAGFTQALTETDARRPLVISATPALGELWLPSRLCHFTRLRADIPIELRLETEDADLERRGVDVRLSYGGELPDYQITPLFYDAVTPVAARPCDPAQERRIAVNWGQSISSVPGWAQWFSNLGVPTPDTGPEITVSSVPAALAMAAAGIGVALLPRRVLASALKAGTVSRCSDEVLPMPRPYVMITAHYKSRSRRLRDLRTALQTDVPSGTP